MPTPDSENPLAQVGDYLTQAKDFAVGTAKSNLMNLLTMGGSGDITKLPSQAVSNLQQAPAALESAAKGAMRVAADPVKAASDEYAHAQNLTHEQQGMRYGPAVMGAMMGAPELAEGAVNGIGNAWDLMQRYGEAAPMTPEALAKLQQNARLGQASGQGGGIMPMAANGKTMDLYHYSHSPNLDVIDPKMYGTGIKGAEASRVLDDTGDLPATPLRSYYYDNPKTKEVGLGPNQYKVRVSGIYDAGKDPMGLFAQAEDKFTNPPTARINPGAFDQDAAYNWFENRVKKSGYSGIHYPDQNAAVVFRKVATDNAAPAAGQRVAKKIQSNSQYARQRGAVDLGGDDTSPEIAAASAPGQAEAIANQINTPDAQGNRGISYHPATGNQPQEGHAVSVYKERMIPIPGEVTPVQVHNYINDNRDIFSKDPDAHFGAWFNKDDGKTYLDISSVHPDKSKAISLADLNGEKAIFDLGSKQETYLKDIPPHEIEAAHLLHAPRQALIDRWLKSGPAGEVEGAQPTPMVHATTADYDEMDPTRSEGFMHAGPPSTSNVRVEDMAGARSLPLFGRAINPARFEDRMGGWNPEIMAQQLVRNGAFTPEIYEHVTAPMKTASNVREGDDLVRQRLTQALEKLGYDSGIYVNRFEGIPDEDWVKALGPVPTDYAGREAWRKQKDILRTQLSDEEFKQKVPNAPESHLFWDPTGLKSVFSEGFNPADKRFGKAEGGQVSPDPAAKTSPDPAAGAAPRAQQPAPVPRVRGGLPKANTAFGTRQVFINGRPYTVSADPEQEARAVAAFKRLEAQQKNDALRKQQGMGQPSPAVPPQ